MTPSARPGTVPRPGEQLPPRRSPESLIDPATLMRIQSLELRARFLVEGFLRGLHRSPHHGSSVEFTEYRQYTPGDDPRYLDWRLYARSDRYHVKRFEEETNLRCHLLLDVSRSMDFGSGPYTKLEYAKTLIATFAFFLNRQRDAVGLATFDDHVVEMVPARFQHGVLRRLMLALEKTVAGPGADFTNPLRQICGQWKRRGMIVLVSDLLAPIESIDAGVTQLASRGHDVVVFRVLDPIELTLNWDRTSELVDLETSRGLFVDPSLAKDAYQTRFNEHGAGLKRICAKAGVELVTLTTDRPFEHTLFDFLQARASRHSHRKTLRKAGI